MSATRTPSAPCRRMNAFCASENVEAFSVFRPSQPREITRKTLTPNGPVFGEQITGRTLRIFGGASGGQVMASGPGEAQTLVFIGRETTVFGIRMANAGAIAR